METLQDGISFYDWKSLLYGGRKTVKRLNVLQYTLRVLSLAREDFSIFVGDWQEEGAPKASDTKTLTPGSQHCCHSAPLNLYIYINMNIRARNRLKKVK